MTVVPLGGEKFIDTKTGKVFSTTGGGYFAGNTATTTPLGDIVVEEKPIVPENSQPSVPSSITTQSVKIATPDIMLGRDEIVPIEIMTNLIFEDIGGQEIINIARTDLVNGQRYVYQPISNLAEVNLQYNSKNILALENTMDTIFNNFPIRLETHIPVVGNGPNGMPVYMDAETGNIVVDVVNMLVGEQVEVQVLSAGELFNDTIY